MNNFRYLVGNRRKVTDIDDFGKEVCNVSGVDSTMLRVNVKRLVEVLNAV